MDECKLATRVSGFLRGVTVLGDAQVETEAYAERVTDEACPNYARSGGRQPAALPLERLVNLDNPGQERGEVERRRCVLTYC